MKKPVLCTNLGPFVYAWRTIIRRGLGAGIGKVFSYCHRRRTRVDGQILDGIDDCEPHGSQDSLWDVPHQHAGVRCDWLFDHALDPACWLESCVAIPLAGGIHRRIQHVLNIRVGDLFQHAQRSVRAGHRLCHRQPGSRFCRCMGWISNCRDDLLEQNHDNSALESDVQGVDFFRKSTLWRCGAGYIYRGFAVATDTRVIITRSGSTVLYTMAPMPTRSTSDNSVFYSALYGNLDLKWPFLKKGRLAR